MFSTTHVLQRFAIVKCHFITIEEAVEPSEHKKTINQTMEDAWKQKALHGKFVNDKEGVNWEKSW